MYHPGNLGKLPTLWYIYPASPSITHSLPETCLVARTRFVLYYLFDIELACIGQAFKYVSTFFTGQGDGPVLLHRNQYWGPFVWLVQSGTSHTQSQQTSITTKTRLKTNIDSGSVWLPVLVYQPPQISVLNSPASLMI